MTDHHQIRSNILSNERSLLLLCSTMIVFFGLQGSDVVVAANSQGTIKVTNLFMVSAGKNNYNLYIIING